MAGRVAHTNDGTSIDLVVSADKRYKSENAYLNGITPMGELPY